MVYSICIDAGSGVMGLLFHAIGSKTTLFCYFITSAIILVAFLAYIYIFPKVLKITKNFLRIATKKMITFNTNGPSRVAVRIPWTTSSKILRFTLHCLLYKIERFTIFKK